MPEEWQNKTTQARKMQIENVITYIEEILTQQRLTEATLMDFIFLTFVTDLVIERVLTESFGLFSWPGQNLPHFVLLYSAPV